MAARRTFWRRLRHTLGQWPALLFLTLVWVLLWGDLSWANVLGGGLLALVVLVVFPLPSVQARGRFRPWPFVVLVGRFLTDLVVASFQVAFLALRPGYRPAGAVVQVRLRNPDDLFLTATAVLSTLVPGTLVLETRRRTGLVFLHVLDVDRAGGPDAVRADIRRLEARVLRAFAPDDVLERCGLGPGAVPDDTAEQSTTDRGGDR
nr:Na+/H+ antiporter subunit E [Isoptericola jiangsuensis]